ncbi:unnamed protein product [Bursaphelenchus okinawaensis]|uniref:Uncharacterized protein n=1 Tax=Bursaphelenchus okinawaensis TaxID=465554 RepID=A0A811LQ43_9BILA|nr:unnamed protein product [Bursaphelenchus okinawaensis]CAG9126894.1 unnamed protein product [Bursaphelenchus okinawaensis]
MRHRKEKKTGVCYKCRKERHVQDIATLALKQSKANDWSTSRYILQSVLWITTIFLFYITYKRDVVCPQLHHPPNTSLPV